MKLKKITSMVRLLLFLLFGFYALYSQEQPTIEIRVNLKGYPTYMPKKALILSNTELAKPIMLLKKANGKIVMEYKGIPTSEAWLPFS
ncbi:MAG: hypothetical protein QNK20_16865, partial [Aureibaculum sp.]|nr:hypothetical protein [Aureibaculum sp.]